MGFAYAAPRVNSWKRSSIVWPLATKSAGVPSKTIRPSLIKITRFAIASTSLQNVRRKQNRLGFAQAFDGGANFADLIWVQTGSRFVKDQDVGLMQQGLAMPTR